MEVAAWLRELGLERYEQAFLDNNIASTVLPELTDEDLKDLGVTLGHRRLMLKAIRALGDDQAGHSPSKSAHAPDTPPQPALRSEPERRQLTVLFCDLVGSTELSAGLDPEDLLEVMRAYQAACAGVIVRFEGHLARFLGDGVLAFFGWPQAHEDDAERAVRAGLQLVQDIARLDSRPGVRLQARVGVATGQVVVGDLISEGISDKDGVIGDTPNLAARLQALAAPGTVVISHSTRRLVGGLFELTDLGPKCLKGFAEPLLIWRAEGEGRAEGRFEALHGERLTPLVGREHELGVLLERWAWAKDGDGQVVLLSGEPGIGKSRLVRELSAWLEDEPHIRLLYQCSPYHTSSPLHPVIEQLERAAGFARDDLPEARLAKLEALLARGTEKLDQALPLVAALLGIATGERYPALKLSPQRQKQLMLEALLDQLTGLAAEQPVLLAYEDVHWIDPTTQGLLGLAIERIQGLPVLLIITFRPEFSSPWSGHPHVTALSLMRLGRREGAVMMDRVVGQKALPDEIARQIIDNTDGVPLFVEELTRAVLESGVLRDAGDRYEVSGPLPPRAIPATLHDSLMARLDRLAPAKEIAQLSAVIGHEFSHALLAAVADRPEEQLRVGLDQLVASELVFRRGVPPNASYTFKHVLVGDVAYGSLLKRKRRQLHARLVEALEVEQPETEREKWNPRHEYGLLAYHCMEAGLLDKAVRYRRKAAALAVRRNARVEAVAHAAQGLKLLKDLPTSLERQADALELQGSLADALLDLEGYKAAATVDAFRRLGELCREMPAGPRLRRALWLLHGYHFARAEWNSARRAAARILHSAENQDDLGAEAMGHRALGLISLVIGDILTARAHFNRVLELHAKHKTTVDFKETFWDVHIQAASYLSIALFTLGYPHAALKMCKEAVASARQSYWDNAIGPAFSSWCRLQQILGQRQAVKDAAEEMVSLVDESAAFWHLRAKVFQVWVSAMAGDRKVALEELRALWASSQEDIRRAPYYEAVVAQAYAVAGHIDEALTLVIDPLRRIKRAGDRWFEAELLRLRAELLLRSAQRDQSESETSLLQALDVARAQSAKTWELRAATSLARLWRDQGRRAEAHDLLAPVYDWFTEGFNTDDLKDAKALLDELA